MIAVLCDAKALGPRRQRGFKAAMVVAVFIVGTWCALLPYLASHHIDRSQTPYGVDWTTGSKFSSLFVIYSFLGSGWSLFQGYIVWVTSTFSNDPSKLSRFNGFIEAMRGLGFAISFGIDSNGTAFLTEGATYFSLLVVGLVLCLLSSARYMSNSEYGNEDAVIVPKDFDSVTLTAQDFRQEKGNETRASARSTVA